jgi:hypothetical protein
LDWTEGALPTFTTWEKENKKLSGFIVYRSVFQIIDQVFMFLFKIHILNEKGNPISFSVYSSIFSVFIFLKNLNYNRPVFDELKKSNWATFINFSE